MVTQEPQGKGKKPALIGPPEPQGPILSDNEFQAELVKRLAGEHDATLSRGLDQAEAERRSVVDTRMNAALAKRQGKRDSIDTGKKAHANRMATALGARNFLKADADVTQEKGKAAHAKRMEASSTKDSMMRQREALAKLDKTLTNNPGVANMLGIGKKKSKGMDEESQQIMEILQAAGDMNANYIANQPKRFDEFAGRWDKKKGKDPGYASPAFGKQLPMRQQQHATEAAKSPLDTIEQAMTVAQKQEGHEAKMQTTAINNAVTVRKAEEDSEERTIKNQRETHKLVTEGKIPAPADYNPQEPVAAEPTNPGVDKVLTPYDEFKKRLGAAEGERSKDQSPRLRNTLRDELLSGLQEALNEKDLRYAPTGIVGQLFGDILDLGSGIVTLGNYQLGTEVFGGLPSGREKLEMVSRVAASTSPLFKSEMAYLTSKDKQDVTAAQRLSGAGYDPRIAAITGGGKAPASSVDETMVIGQDIELGFRNNLYLKDHFGPDASTTIGAAFSSFRNYEQADNVIKQLLEIEEPTQKDLANLDEFIQKRDAYEEEFNEYLLQYAANGKHPLQTFGVATRVMQDYVDTNYTNLSASDDPMLPAHARKTVTLKKLVGDVYAEQAARFSSKGMGVLLDEQAIVERKFGKRSRQAKGLKEASKLELPVGTYWKGTIEKLNAVQQGITGAAQTTNYETAPIDASIVSRMRGMLKTRYSADDAYSKLGDKLEKIVRVMKFRDPEQRQKMADLLHDSVKKGSQHASIKHQLIDDLIVKQEYRRSDLPPLPWSK